jgi:hypothetical protein
MNKDRLSTQSTNATSADSEFKIDDIIEKLVSVKKYISI